MGDFNDPNDISMKYTYGSEAYKRDNDPNYVGSTAWIQRLANPLDIGMRYVYGSAAYKKRLEEENAQSSYPPVNTNDVSPFGIIITSIIFLIVVVGLIYLLLT